MWRSKRSFARPAQSVALWSSKLVPQHVGVQVLAFVAKPEQLPESTSHVARMGYLAKPDAIDAVALAHLAQTLAAKADQAGVAFCPPSDEVEQLQLMVTRRMQLLTMRTAETNRRASAGRVLQTSITRVIKTL